MWKRIRSERDPRDTIFSELRKAFGCQLDEWSERAKQHLSERPRATFLIMAMTLILSFPISIFLLHETPPQQNASKRLTRPTPNSIGQLWRTTGQLAEAIQLKAQIDSICAKKVLTPADSVTLIKALDQLQHLDHR